MMDTLTQETRYAIRKLLRNPGFTVVAVAALALGIGANTAIFSVVNAVLIRPLPFQDPDRLVVIWESNLQQNKERELVSPLTFRDWEENSSSFVSMAAWAWWGYSMTGTDEAETIAAIRTSPNLFSLLGVEPALGRTFVEEENIPGGPNAAIISHGLWQRRFGGADDVVGRTVNLDLQPYTIVGVMPAGFQFPDHERWELWAPAKFTDEELSSRVRRQFNIMARLAPGVTLEQARSELGAIAAGIAEEFPDTNIGWGVSMVAARELIQASNGHLLILFVAAGFVLLIACANVANLLLARAADRHKEIAIRRALGGSRFSLVRQLLIESLLLAALGGGAAVLIAVWGIDIIMALEPGDLPAWNAVQLDLNVFAFTAGLALFTSFISGLVPAIHASKPDLNDSLKEGGGKFTAGAGARRVRNVIVVAEIALAVVLLIGAGLLIRSFARVLNEELGFEPSGVVAANVFLADTRYPDEHLQVAFFDEVLEGIRSVPGVVAAGATLALPLNAVSIDFDLPFDIEGQAPHEPGREPQADYRVITPDYLAVMRIPLLRGRVFDSRDREGAPNVMIVNQTMALRYFPGEDPVGKRVRIPIGGWHEVVGIIGDVRDRGLDSEPRAEFYVPFHEHPFSGMVITARTNGSTSSLAQAITREVFAVDPDQTITRLATMNELISESVARRRFNMTLLGAFAALALVLAAIGIYGVISYGVSQRTREIGVRLAIGAQQNDVVKMVVTQALKLAAAGVVIGALGAFALTRVMASLLYEVSPADPTTFVGVPIVLALTAVAASYAPALRATRVDPVLALRHE